MSIKNKITKYVLPLALAGSLAYGSTAEAHNKYTKQELIEMARPQPTAESVYARQLLAELREDSLNGRIVKAHNKYTKQELIKMASRQEPTIEGVWARQSLAELREDSLKAIDDSNVKSLDAKIDPLNHLKFKITHKEDSKKADILVGSLIYAIGLGIVGYAGLKELSKYTPDE